MAKKKPTTKPTTPTVDDFLNAQKVANNSAQTVQRTVRRAYDAAQAATRQPGDKYDRLDLLDNEADRNAFKARLTDGLTSPYQAAIAAMPDVPEIGSELVLNGALGFGPREASGIVDAMKSGLSLDAFIQALGENTKWQEAVQRRLAMPGAVLDRVSAADVGSYVGVSIKNPDKLGVRDKAELIQLYDKFGIVPAKVLKDKPYM